LWICAVDDVEFTAGRQHLTGLAGFASARLLVRSGRLPRGFVELPIADGRIDSSRASAEMALLSPAQPRPVSVLPPISIVLCTFDRPKMLADALTTLLDLDYPEFEILVVDNNPASGLTPPVVSQISDSRVRLVSEPRRGLARARNTGAISARNERIAFTDDDVVVDRYWLQGMADGFSAGGDVACVSGIVPSGEILSAAQDYFDRRVSWARNVTREVFSLAVPRPSEPLFPFQVARFGTGANFAVDRRVLIEIGGFDEGLGVGSHCGGGEDIDLFLRVLLAGHQLAYEPSAVVWHKHRIEFDSLRRQIVDYGTGLGAWLTKLALSPRTLPMMVRRFLPGLRHLARTTQPAVPVPTMLPEHAFLWRVERRAVLVGPLALAKARLSGARKRPLATSARPIASQTQPARAMEAS
jgi:GT2 family glycosyltransferase